MLMHAKKRIDIVAEAPVLKRLEALLDEAGVSGYTVLPALAGRGHHGDWSREGLAGDAGRMICVFCIVDPAKVEPILEKLEAVVQRQIAIVAVSNVEVIRGDHF
jgi:PII-like signaling protein